MWTLFTKRTDDPKLGYIEWKLDERGIPHRRNGSSFHAPILEVPAEHLDAAWALLNQPFDESGKTLDDIDDDDPVFGEGEAI